MQKNDKIDILTLQFMSLKGYKSSDAIFGTFICRFHNSTALSELNVPLPTYSKHSSKRIGRFST